MADVVSAPAAGAPAAGGAPEAPPDRPVLEVVQDEPQPQNAADADEDDGPDDDADVPYRNDPHYKGLRNKTRSLQRKLAKAREAAARYAGVNVDDVVFKARQYDELERKLQSNPTLRKIVGGEQPQAEKPAGAGDFDPASFPFDPEAPGSSYLLEQAKTVHGLKQQLAQQQQLTQRLLAHLTGREHQDVVTHWKSATEEAVKRLPDRPVRYGDVLLNVRELFSDAVYGAFQTMTAKNMRITKERAADVINHYLRKYGAVAGGQQPSAADRQRAAEKSTQWPTSLGGGRGSPASPKPSGLNIHQVTQQMRQGKLGPR